MKGNRFLIRAALFVSVVMFGVCAATAEKKPDMSVYGDVIAKAGQSEIVMKTRFYAASLVPI